MKKILIILCGVAAIVSIVTAVVVAYAGLNGGLGENLLILAALFVLIIILMIHLTP